MSRSLPEFSIGDAVWHRADTGGESLGIVVALVYYRDQIFYRVQWGTAGEGEHQDFELTAQRPLESA